MKLNIGCGEYYAEGWTNLDVDPDVQPDIVGSLLDLPAEIDGVTSVYLGHVAEFLPQREIVSALTRLWQRCEPGCTVAAVSPDIARLWDMALRGDITHINAVAAITGARLWACDERRLLDLVRASGLWLPHPVSITSPLLNPWPVVSRIGWQCAVIGTVQAYE